MAAMPICSWILPKLPGRPSSTANPTHPPSHQPVYPVAMQNPERKLCSHPSIHPSAHLSGSARPRDQYTAIHLSIRSSIRLRAPKEGESVLVVWVFARAEERHAQHLRVILYRLVQVAHSQHHLAGQDRQIGAAPNYSRSSQAQ
jgi:hypothetical protein